nr:centrosome-associated protein CEP250-like isoform X3 [Procambarus clarkii]
MEHAEITIGQRQGSEKAEIMTEQLEETSTPGTSEQQQENEGAETMDDQLDVEKGDQEEVDQIQHLEKRDQEAVDQVQQLKKRHQEAVDLIQQLKKRDQEAVDQVQQLKKRHQEAVDLIQQLKKRDQEAVDQIQQLKKRDQEAADQIQQLKKRDQEAVDQIQQLKKRHQEAVDQIQQLKKRDQEAADQIQQLKKRDQEAVDQIQQLKKRHQEAVDQIQQLKKRHQEAVDQIQQLKKRHQETVDQIQQLKKGHQEAADQIQQLKKRHQETVDQIQQLKKGHQEAVDQIQQLKKRHQEAVDLIQQLKKRDQEAVDQIQQLKKRDQEAVDLIQQLKKRHQEAVDQIQQLKKRDQEAVDQIQQLKKRDQEAVDQIQQLKKRDQEAADQIQQLKKRDQEAVDLIQQLKKRDQEAVDQIQQLKKEQLLRAVREGSAAVVKRLLESGVDVETVTSWDDTAGYRALHLAAVGGHDEVTRVLMQAGADVTARDHYGDEAIHTASRSGHAPVVNQLLNHNKDQLYDLDHDGRTAAHLATAGGHVAVLEVLQRYGNILDVRDQDGRSLLEYSEANDQVRVTEWLLVQGVQWPPLTSWSFHIFQASYPRLAWLFKVLTWFVKTSLRWLSMSPPLDPKLKIQVMRTPRPIQQPLQQKPQTEQRKLQTEQQKPQTEQQKPQTEVERQKPQTEVEQQDPQTEVEQQDPQTEMEQQDPQTEVEQQKPQTEVEQGTSRLQQQTEQQKPQTEQQKHGEKRKSQEKSRRSKRTVSAVKEDLRPHGSPTKLLQEDHYPNGLPNIGNTCYMNAVLQCLYHTQPLTQHFCAESGKQGKVSSVYQALVRALDSGTGLQDAVQRLKKIVGSQDEIFLDCEQKEAHDFLSMMLHWLYEELPHAPKRRKTGVELFYGEHKSTITCKRIGKVLNTVLEPFSNLTLPVNKKGWCSLQDLLDHYYRQRDIEWWCENCGEEHMCQQQTTIQHLPDLLIVHLSRYQKNNLQGGKSKLTFPSEDLDLTGFTNGKEESHQYELYGVCVHQGTMTYGHYSAFCRRWDSTTWFHFNDLSVRVIGKKQVLQQHNAHILFYKTQGVKYSYGEPSK